MTPKHGTIFWNELNTRDTAKAAEFYAKTLGWEIETSPMPDGGTYSVGKVGDDMVGGIFQMEGPDFEGIPDHWFTYFAVDDVDASVEAYTANGGAVIRPPFDVPGVARFAIVQDAVGAPHGTATPSD